MNVQQQLAVVFQSFERALLEVAPRVVTGLAIVIGLLVAARLAERFLRSFLLRIQFDELLKRSGIDKTLKRLGVRQSPAQVLPRFAYYLLLLAFARIGADVLGLIAVSQAISSMFAYLPNVLAAVLLLAVGTSIAQFAGGAVTQAAEESGIDFAKSLGSIVSGLIVFVVGIMAIAQLKIDTDMVRIFTVCLLSGFALAFGLSFGLGTRDITRNILAGFYARKVFQPGDPVEIRGHRGVLKSIMATQTVVEHDQGVILFANSVFLDETVRS
jgi:small-conductance mechanosensitive channel